MSSFSIVNIVDDENGGIRGVWLTDQGGSAEHVKDVAKSILKINKVINVAIVPERKHCKVGRFHYSKDEIIWRSDKDEPGEE